MEIKQLKEQVKPDLQRFSKLHLWYKTLPYEGKNFIIFPWKGQQPKNYINPEINDFEGYHWHIWDSNRIDEIPLEGIAKDIVMRRLVTFNCFLWGVNYSINGDVYTKGWSELTMKYPNIKKDLEQKYSNKQQISNMIQIESEKQINYAINNTIEIINEMAEHCPEYLGLSPLKKVSIDPTNEICKSNLKNNFSSEMLETRNGRILQIKRTHQKPIETPKGDIYKKESKFLKLSFSPSLKRKNIEKTSPRKPVKRLSLRDLKNFSSRE